MQFFHSNSKHMKKQGHHNLAYDLDNILFEMFYQSLQLQVGEVATLNYNVIVNPTTMKVTKTKFNKIRGINEVKEEIINTYEIHGLVKDSEYNRLHFKGNYFIDTNQMVSFKLTVTHNTLNSRREFEFVKTNVSAAKSKKEPIYVNWDATKEIIKTNQNNYFDKVTYSEYRTRKEADSSETDFNAYYTFNVMISMVLDVIKENSNHIYFNTDEKIIELQ